MANITVKDSLSNPQASNRTRYEKMEKAYGKIAATDYTASGDVLIFSGIPAREIIHVALVNSLGTQKEFFYGTDFSNAVTFAMGNTTAATKDIYYTVEYIRGTGKIDDGSNQKGEGQLLKVAVTFS